MFTGVPDPDAEGNHTTTTQLLTIRPALVRAVIIRLQKQMLYRITQEAIRELSQIFD